MATRRAWTPDDDAALRRHIAAGDSIAKTASAMNRAMSTVEGHAKTLGLSWNRDANIAATKALVADTRARRAAFRADLMTDLERLKDQMFKPTTVYNFGGKDNSFEEAVLDKPPIADQLRIVQALAAGVATIEKLENMDADQGVVDATGLLDAIGDAIKAAAAAMDELL